ncbi:sigma-70 family RNA polymerase sigma factor [Actinoplanes sp. TRM 88003]|uniref:Sigma-70 family RNA polymerase sigma factor n=1 Tax=Paractinoplanes aksuensis TaxID=2939490 RepID=A0ABT1DFW6_9ACTN|nr:sigma-70 family RNA polymerase sigma factor [Actinoplanes aksuensis]MCO8269383.1 sigma-70 family RNA polymerase sigma factor [Actinoplanes aksuensis]
MGPQEISPSAEFHPPPPASEFAPFYDRMFPSLVKYGAVVWGSVSDAEDAANDALTYLYRRWYSIANKEAYARTMVTRSIGRLRRDAAWRSDRLDQAGPARPYAENDDGTTVTACVDRQWIIELLAKLPPAQRAVMAGFIDQVPTADIADALGTNEAAVRKNLQLARQRLRQEVEQDRARDRSRPLPKRVATTTLREETR